MIERMWYIIELQEPTKSIDDYGQPLLTFTKLADVNAAMDHKGSDEVEKSDVRVDENKVEFTVRFTTTTTQITKSHRIKYGSLLYDIEGITPIGRNRFLKINAVSRGDLI